MIWYTKIGPKISIRQRYASNILFNRLTKPRGPTLYSEVLHEIYLIIVLYIVGGSVINNMMLMLALLGQYYLEVSLRAPLPDSDPRI